MNCSNAIQLVENDEEAIRLVWVDQDLTEFTSIKMRVRLEAGELLVVDAVIIEPGPAPEGITDFLFAAGTLPAGNHLAEFETVDTSGRQDTFPDEAPLPLLVRERL